MAQMKAKRRIRPTADIVSMVTRPSSRVPFRIMKSEGDDDMNLNLELLFKSEAVEEVAADPVVTETPEPTLMAVMVAKSVSLENATTQVAAAGFSVDTVQDTPQAHVFVQNADAMGAEDVMLMKASDEVGVAIAHVSKMFCDWQPDSVSFQEVLAQSGLCGMVQVAKSALSTVIDNAIYSAETPEQAKTAVSKAASDFGIFVERLIANVPVLAFKAETITFDAPAEVADSGTQIVEKQEAPAAQAEPAGVDMIDTAKDQVSKEDAPAEEPTAEAEEEKPEADAGEPAKAEGGDDQDPEPVAKSADPLEAIMKRVEDLITAQTQAASASMELVQKSVDGLGERLTAVETVATAAQATAERVIPTPAPGDRMPVEKSESRPNRSPDLIDTGLRAID